MHREYFHSASGKIIQMRPFDLSRDLTRLYSWVHEPHVIPQWKLNFPIHQLIEHFKKALNDPHQSLFILSVDHTEVCYAETYYAPDDILSKYVSLHPGDYGIHLLIGPPHAKGKGNAAPLLCMLTDYLFSVCQAKRVLVEPDHQVKPMTILERKLGFNNLGLIQLPDKTATLYAALKPHFYKVNPDQSLETQNTSKTILCDIKEWPLVRFHFGSNPTDDAVIRWLEELDILLKISEPCVVLSTFSENYQFTTDARRYQAVWFKKNKDKLSTYCLGMVRVTEDLDLIKKITSSAMRKGMPFHCIPVSTLSEGYVLANKILISRTPLSLRGA
jgi:acetyl CoA:N6-hydroxylysine acetyl transferase